MGDSPKAQKHNVNDKDDQEPHAARTTREIPPPTLSPLQSDNWANYIPSTDHVRFFQSINWAATQLGPLAGWPTALRLHVFTLLADSRAACVYWGPQKISIYNEEFVPLAGKAHPALMGSTFEEGFPEIWDTIKPVFDGAERTGVAHDVKDMLMFVERSGFVEETYFTGNFTPLRDDTGLVGGFYNAVHEITQIKINERRRETLQLMQIPVLSEERRLDSHVIPSLKLNPYDVPMAIIYKVDEESTPGTTLCVLQDRIGVPDSHPFATETMDLGSSEGLMPLLRKARQETITVQVDKTFDGLEWRGFGDPCKFVSIIPVQVTGKLYGFLVIGANPRRAIDEDYHQFMRNLSTQLSSISTSILSSEETRKRELFLQRQLEDRHRRITFMAQHAVIGMSYLMKDGRTMWANEEYYEITKHPRAEESQYKLSFLDTFLAEDQPKALEAWNRVIQGEVPLSLELRLKRKFSPPTGDPEPAVVRCHHFPVVEEGILKLVMTFTTDVSAFKWAESSEARKAAEAHEAKRQQEEFIDFVSHELRNPLSAIFQLAETIITSYPITEGIEVSRIELSQALEQNIDNANTILMCAKHQKRIVDDVLTLSKLEYTMLSVSPVPVQLPFLVQKWMKMFEAQISFSGLTVDVHSSPFLKVHSIDWVLCDELRIQQIFINLLTNAIKFTKTEMKREIKVEYGAALMDPRLAFPKAIKWAPSQREIKDLTMNPDWGLGQQLYLTFSVTDTGIGMTDEEIKRLFGRFEQASAKTSIKYGGSGLGLFLSQRLAERQAGEIGVFSEPGKGSTFAFYVKSRRTEETSSGLDTHRQAPPLRSKSHSFTTSFPAPDLKKMHVLLVEDNTVNQRVLQAQLKKAGCVVYIANHGVEALEMIRESDIWHENEHKPKDLKKHLDIILMDWEMPIMDGLACSREIRDMQKAGKVLKHVEIVATTANARDEQIRTALESGIDSVMSKPFMVSDLLERMRERLSVSTGTRPAGAERAVTEPLQGEGGWI